MLISSLIFGGCIIVASSFISTNVTPGEMVLVKGGKFNMGDKEDISLFMGGISKTTPLHQVVISDFYIGKYEVTFSEYDRFCEQIGRVKPKDEGWGRGMRPVVNITWREAIEYCNWLSVKNGLTPCYIIDIMNIENVVWDLKANGYRLPTEAEWEYAAKGGSKSKGYNFSGSNNVGEVAWYWLNALERSSKIGQKMPNELGLYDMSGNASEWCWDKFSKQYYEDCAKLGLVDNPTGPEKGGAHVDRGGCWGGVSDSVRVVFRNSYGTSRKLIGFRLAKSI